MSNKRDYLAVGDLAYDEVSHLIDRAIALKKQDCNALAGKNVALIFEKPSLRTRSSFEVAVKQLGGNTVYLGNEEVGLGKREPVSDMAKVMSGYYDGIVARVFSHQSLEELKAHSTIPVINALSDWEHPCQILCDMLTITEHKGRIEGLTVAYVSDGDNNIARSLCLMLTKMGANFHIASPEGYKLDQQSVDLANKNANHNAKAVRFDSVEAAVKGADVVYTDVWASMGQEAELAKREIAFEGYIVSPELMTKANPDAIFMHDMPVQYGREVTEGMLDHPQSVAYPQAHNRLHMQKALLEFLL